MIAELLLARLPLICSQSSNTDKELDVALFSCDRKTRLLDGYRFLLWGMPYRHRPAHALVDARKPQHIV